MLTIGIDGMKQVKCVHAKAVPIVKMLDPELDLNCDLNVNNDLALINTQMVRTYIEMDDRVRPLALIIKHWSKRRIINEGKPLMLYQVLCHESALILPSFGRDPELVYMDSAPHQFFANTTATGPTSHGSYRERRASKIRLSGRFNAI